MLSLPSSTAFLFAIIPMKVSVIPAGTSSEGGKPCAKITSHTSHTSHTTDTTLSHHCYSNTVIPFENGESTCRQRFTTTNNEAKIPPTYSFRFSLGFSGAGGGDREGGERAKSGGRKKAQRGDRFPQVPRAAPRLFSEANRREQVDCSLLRYSSSTIFLRLGLFRVLPPRAVL